MGLLWLWMVSYNILLFFLPLLLGVSPFKSSFPRYLPSFMFCPAFVLDVLLANYRSHACPFIMGTYPQVSDNCCRNVLVKCCRLMASCLPTLMPDADDDYD